MDIVTTLVMGSILSHTVSSLIDKKIACAPKEGSSFSAAMFKMKANTIVFAPLIIVFWQTIITGGIAFFMAAAVLGVFYGIAAELYFRGLRVGEASVLFPFQLSITIVLVYIASLVFFDEALTIQRTLGVIGVIAGNGLLIYSGRQAMDKSEDRLREETGNRRLRFSLSFFLASLKSGGILYFMGVVIAVACYQLLSKKFAFSVQEGFALAGFMYVFTVLTLLVINARNLITSKDEYLYTWKLFLKNWHLLFIGSATALIGRWLFYDALIGGGEATFVLPFFDGGQLMTLAIAAVLILRERMSVIKGSAIAILCISVLAISTS